MKEDQVMNAILLNKDNKEIKFITITIKIVAFLVKIDVQFLVSYADIAALFLEFFVESDFLIVASFVVLADPSFEFFTAVVSQIPEAVDPFDLIIKMIIDHSLHFYF